MTAHSTGAERTWRALVMSFLLTAGTIVIVHVINPFGLEAATEARVAQVIRRIAAPTYGWDLPATPGQLGVSVVLIDAPVATLPGTREPTWPLPVNTLIDDVVMPILAQRPAALFIDLAFPNAPRQIVPGGAVDTIAATAELARRLRGLGSSGIPVFISDVLEPRRDTDCRRLDSVMSRDLRDAVFRPGGPPSGQLMRVNSRVETPEGAYSLLTEAGCAGGRVASPALALVNAYCRIPTNRQSCQQANVAAFTRRIRMTRTADGVQLATMVPAGWQRSMPAETGGEAIDLRWGTRLSPATLAAYGKLAARECPTQFRVSLTEPVNVFWRLISGWVESRQEHWLERKCPFIDTIAADQLTQRFDDWAPHVPGALPKRRTGADLFVKERIVLLGVNLVQTGDQYASPVNGLIPGVYFHAVAVENLLTRGIDFARAEPSTWAWAGVLVVASLIVFLMKLLWHALCSRMSATVPPFGEIVIAPISYLLIVVVLGGPVIAALSRTSLPMVEIALPVAALHIELLAKIVDRIEERVMESWLGSS